MPALRTRTLPLIACEAVSARRRRKAERENARSWSRADTSPLRLRAGTSVKGRFGKITQAKNAVCDRIEADIKRVWGVMQPKYFSKARGLRQHFGIDRLRTETEALLAHFISRGYVA